MKNVTVKKDAPISVPQVRTDAVRRPGAAMLRLLNEAELKTVSGGRSGPSPRGRGH